MVVVKVSESVQAIVGLASPWLRRAISVVFADRLDISLPLGPLLAASSMSVRLVYATEIWRGSGSKNGRCGSASMPS